MRERPSEAASNPGASGDRSRRLVSAARTVGFASPTKVWKDSKEITEGSVVLSIDYVKKIAKAKQSALYLHELGHALGLGHGTDKSNVMYYLVDNNNTLSPGDIQGIRALVQACKTPTS